MTPLFARRVFGHLNHSGLAGVLSFFSCFDREEEQSKGRSCSLQDGFHEREILNKLNKSEW